jgi:hypothetical protein
MERPENTSKRFAGVTARARGLPALPQPAQAALGLSLLVINNRVFHDHLSSLPQTRHRRLPAASCWFYDSDGRRLERRLLHSSGDPFSSGVRIASWPSVGKIIPIDSP